MRVMVTGGTGFVGAHSVATLRAAGHEVSLLVRDAIRIATNIGALGVDVDALDHVAGDMTDEAAVVRALDGCDAVLHCAAVVSLDRRRAREVRDQNPRGVEVVVGTALERGLDPVVYASSASALFRPGVPVLRADLPPAPASGPYARSKADAEGLIRRWQGEGAPVTSTYPGGVVGPPAGTAFGEMADALVTHLRMGLMPLRDGALSIIDVRDVASVHTAAMEAGRGPRRFMCGGHFLTMEALAAVYHSVTGRRFPIVPVPAASVRGLGRVMDGLMRVTPISSVVTGEAMDLLTGWVPSDDSRISDDLGVVLRPVEDTLADAFRALYDAGRLTRSQVGRLVVGGTDG